LRLSLCAASNIVTIRQGFEYSNVYRGMAEKTNIADETKA
jgi:hypothetical protein